MLFLFPWGLAALVLVPALFFIHRLRVPGRTQTVSFLPLWERVLQRASAVRTHRQRRFDRLFLLEAAVVALLSLALAQTAVRWGASPRRLAVVVDLSASLQTSLPAGGTRWDRARELTDRFLRSLLDTDHITLVLCEGAQSIRIQTLEPVEARSVLRQALPSDAPATGEELAHDWVARLDRDHDAVFFVTDSLDPAVKATLSPNVHCVTVGEPVENLGLTRWAARTLTDHTEILVTVLNTGNVDRGVDVLLITAVGPVASQSDQVNAGSSHDFVFRLPGGDDAPSRLVTEILHADGKADAFPLDDRVEASRLNLSVLMVGESSPDLTRFFNRVFPHTTTLTEIGQSQALAGLPAADLVVFNRATISQESLGASLTFNLQGERAGSIGLGRVQETPAGLQIVGGNDVLLESVGLRAIRPGSYRGLSLGEGVKPLLWLGSDVVGAVERRARGPRVVFGFDLERSGWARDPSFVVFMVNLLREVTGTGRPPDEPFVVLPTGSWLRQGGGTEWSQKPILKAGEVEFSGGRARLTAALLNASESELPASKVRSPRATLPTGVRRAAWNPLTSLIVSLASVVLFLWWAWPR